MIDYLELTVSIPGSETGYRRTGPTGGNWS